MRKKPHTVYQLTKGLNINLDPTYLTDNESPNLRCIRYDKGLVKKDLGFRNFSPSTLAINPYYPPEFTGTYVKATSTYTGDYLPQYTTDPSKSLIGGFVSNSWVSANLAITNQRFHIDYGSKKIVTRLYYENNHNSGLLTNAGAKNFTLWGSNDAAAFADLVYGHDTNWTQIGGAFQLEQHTGSNIPDPKYITIPGTVPYRYYAFKFADNWGNTSYMGVRRIVLQEVEPDPYLMFMDSFPILTGATHYLFMTPRQIYTLRNDNTLEGKIDTPLTGTRNDPFSSTVTYDHLGNDLYVITNRIDPIKKWDGSAATFTNLTGWNNILAGFVISYKNRLIAMNLVDNGYTSPVRIRWSVAGDPEDIVGAGSGFVDLADTPDWITGACLYKDRLLIFKERSIWELVYVGGTTIFVPVRRVDGVGCSASNTMISLGDYVIFFGTDGIYLYDTYTMIPISDPIYPLLYPTDTKIVNLEFLNRARAVYVEEIEEYWLVLPTQGQIPNLLLKYNFGTESWTRVDREITAFGYYSIAPGAAWIDEVGNWTNWAGIWMDHLQAPGAPTTLAGDSLGNIREDDRAQPSTETMIFETKDWIFEHAFRITEVRGGFKGGPFEVSFSLDGGLTYSNPQQFAAKTDWTECVVWVNKTSQRLRMKVTTSAANLEIKWAEPWYIERKRSKTLASS